jgi:hypothetical protein
MERARRASETLKALQRDSKWHPALSQVLARDFQQARAILSKAEATFAAWRRGLPWAGIDQAIAEYDAFASFVRDLHERGGWRARGNKKGRPSR